MLAPSPLQEIPASLRFVCRETAYYGEPSGPGQAKGCGLSFTPDLPGLVAAADLDGVVLDPLALIDAAQTPGAYALLTCTCGDALHAGIESPIFVSHPTADKIVWEIDTCRSGSLLAAPWRGRRGFIRLCFERPAYHLALHEMRGLVEAANKPEKPVVEIQPDCGGCALERWLARDVEATLAQRHPLFAEGSRIEIGCQGAMLLSIDGHRSRQSITGLLPRWGCFAAYERWCAFFQRGHDFTAAEVSHAAQMNLSNATGRQAFFLIDAQQREACDAAGEYFVNHLLAAWQESNAAPGVTLRYRPLPASAILAA